MRCSLLPNWTLLAAQETFQEFFLGEQNVIFSKWCAGKYNRFLMSKSDYFCNFCKRPLTLLPFCSNFKKNHLFWSAMASLMGQCFSNIINVENISSTLTVLTFFSFFPWDKEAPHELSLNWVSMAASAFQLAPRRAQSPLCLKPTSTPPTPTPTLLNLHTHLFVWNTQHEWG